MLDRRKYISLVLLCLAVLACNAPQPPGPEAAPTATPYIPQEQETPPTPTGQPQEQETPPAPTGQPPAASPTPTVELPTPEPELSPTTSPPTPTSQPVSAGPLDFPQPTAIDGYQELPGGGIEVTIILHITGGAPPFTIRHDLDVFQSAERDYPLVFRHDGCSAIVHTITVESADGQVVSHDYWIGADMLPWCD